MSAVIIFVASRNIRHFPMGSIEAVDGGGTGGGPRWGDWSWRDDSRGWATMASALFISIKYATNGAKDCLFTSSLRSPLKDQEHTALNHGKPSSSDQRAPHVPQ